MLSTCQHSSQGFLTTSQTEREEGEGTDVENGFRAWSCWTWVNRHANHVVKDLVERSDMQQHQRERRCALCGKGYQRR